MTWLFTTIAIFLVLLMFLPLFRVIKGPTLFDRIIAAGLMGTNGVLILTVICFIYDRLDMFIDLAIAYALLNFIGTVAIGKYMEKHGREAR